MDREYHGDSYGLSLSATLLYNTCVYFKFHSYRVHILVLTFVVYAAYHMSRKPFSVVAVSCYSCIYIYEFLVISCIDLLD